nr:MAG TPA_asm: Receptor Binding Protein [Caudoviricetes sp.]
MADIITYPENGIQYYADDASGYLATRLSGVYSADEDFAVTANGGLTVTVSAGQAWVRPARFRGRSIIMEQPETVTLTAADAVRSRIDRLVLRYDAAARKTSLTVLTGTPDSASPTAPEITRTALVYDLCLADIRRPAGSTVVTAADITDTRADEAVCGVMRDGVKGIPTAQLQAQALAIMTQLSTELHTKLDALDAAIAAVESGNFYTKSEADAKFGTPYSLPAATAAQLGGVKVGDYLDIAPDGTLSAKTLNDKIAAAVAVKSEPRLVWNHYEETGKKWKTYDIKMPDGLDYVHVKTKYNSPTGGYGEEVDIAKGGTANHSYGNGTGIFASNTTFQTNGTLHFATETSTGGYTVEIWLTGYHYPTLAELLTETQAAQDDADALNLDQDYRLTLLELGVTDDETTETA